MLVSLLFVGLCTFVGLPWSLLNSAAEYGFEMFSVECTHTEEELNSWISLLEPRVRGSIVLYVWLSNPVKMILLCTALSTLPTFVVLWSAERVCQENLRKNPGLVLHSWKNYTLMLVSKSESDMFLFFISHLELLIISVIVVEFYYSNWFLKCCHNMKCWHNQVFNLRLFS